jgi:hypothetical protein
MQLPKRTTRDTGNIFWMPVVLAAVVPFVSFAAENVGEDVSLAWLLVYALGVAILSLGLTLAFAPFGRRTMSRVGFVVSVFVFVFFSFSVVQYVTGVNEIILYPLHGALTLVACMTAWFLSAQTLAWHVWVMALVVMTITPAITYLAHLSRLDRGSHLADDASASAGSSKPVILPGHLRNVYYLTLDGYPRADSLREFFDFDNSNFIDFLKSNAFLVSENSYANYMATYLSVSTAFEQNYVVSQSESNFWDRTPWFKEILNGDNRVFKRFHELGYFVAKLDFFDECKSNVPYVDYCYGNDKQQMRINLRLTELEFTLLRLTPLYDLVTNHFAHFIHRHLDTKNVDNVLDMVKYLKTSAPRIFFSHVLLPHLPYRFSSDCTPSKEVDGARLGDTPRAKELFLNQTRCANIQTKNFVEFVVRIDPDAIIILSSDHGSPFVDWSLPYDKWPASAVRERFGILNAMRLPETCKTLFYDRISPVNFFELVFACIEQREPHFREDRIYISTFDKMHKQYGQVWRYR